MADNIATPVGVLGSKLINGAQVPWGLLADVTGVDAMGTADGNPDANTLLGYLKAVAAGQTAIIALLGALVSQGGGNPSQYVPSFDFSDPRNSQYL